MGTPPMIRQMNEREVSYTKRKLAETAKQSKQNFAKFLKSQEPKQEPAPDQEAFIFRLQDRSRRLLGEQISAIKQKAEARAFRASFTKGKQVLNTSTWAELAKADELASAEVWQKEASKREKIEQKERQRLKSLALTIRKENEKRSKAQAEKVLAEQQ